MTLALALLLAAGACAEDFDIGVLLKRLAPDLGEIPPASIILPAHPGSASQTRSLKWEGKPIEVVLDPTLHEPRGLGAYFQRGSRGFTIPQDRMHYFPQSRTLRIPDLSGVVEIGESFTLHYDDSARVDDLNSRAGFLRTMRARSFAVGVMEEPARAWMCALKPNERGGRTLEVAGKSDGGGRVYFHSPEEDLDAMLAFLDRFHACASRAFPPPVRYDRDR